MNNPVTDLRQRFQTLQKLPPGGLSPEQKAQRAVRRQIISVVGLVALILIPCVWLVDQVVGLQCTRDSLSHYFYSPLAGTLFVVAMASVGMLLLTYRGETPRDTKWAWGAGLGALAVAMFSTVGPGYEAGTTCDVQIITPLMLPLSQSDAATGVNRIEEMITVTVALSDAFQTFPGIQYLHYAGVTVLFIAMIAFCGVFFRLASDHDKDKAGKLKPQKVTRNRIYLGCATVLVICGGMLLAPFFFTEEMAVWWRAWNGTLWIEIVSFMVIGLAWLVKGRFFNAYLTSN